MKKFSSGHASVKNYQIVFRDGKVRFAAADHMETVGSKVVLSRSGLSVGIYEWTEVVSVDEFNVNGVVPGKGVRPVNLATKPHSA